MSEDKYFENPLNKHLDSQLDTEGEEYISCEEKIVKERLNDSPDWIIESFSEGDMSLLSEMTNAYLNTDLLRIGVIVQTLMDDYIIPTSEQVMDRLTEDNAFSEDGE